MPAVVIPPGGGRAFMPQGKVKLGVGQSPDFAAFEPELPALSAGPPAHIHRIYDEAFYVLEGQVHTCWTASNTLAQRDHSYLCLEGWLTASATLHSIERECSSS